MRAGFALQGAAGKGVQAYAPLYPHPRQEQWYFILADTANNAIFSLSVHTLLEAEAAGLKQRQNQLALAAPPDGGDGGGLRQRSNKGSLGDLSRAGGPQHEIVKQCKSTSKSHGKALQNLMLALAVQSTQEPLQHAPEA